MRQLFGDLLNNYIASENADIYDDADLVQLSIEVKKYRDKYDDIIGGCRYAVRVLKAERKALISIIRGFVVADKHDNMEARLNALRQVNKALRLLQGR